MFSLIWRFLPGPAWLRIVCMLAVLGVIVYALIFYGYPWATQFFDTEQDLATVGS